jgi:transposase-like protein
MNKRRAKPTAQQLANRTYRKQIATEKFIVNQLEWITSRLRSLQSGQKMLAELIESVRLAQVDTMKPLADHCRRLLREKESLMKANAFMAEAPRSISTRLDVNAFPRIQVCGFKLLHRPGIRCAVCGELSMADGATA